MKKFLVLAIALFTTVLFINTASAGFLLEPYVGYEKGDSEQQGNTDEYTGINVGARLGMTFMGMFGFGIDYMTGQGKNDAAVEQDYTFTDYGPYFMVDFPLPIRLYVVYLLHSDYLVETPIIADLEFEGSGGTKIGLSFTGLPFIAINAELISRTWDELNGNDLANDAESDTYMLSVSLPLP